MHDMFLTSVAGLLLSTGLILSKLSGNYLALFVRKRFTQADPIVVRSEIRLAMVQLGWFLVRFITIFTPFCVCAYLSLHILGMISQNTWGTFTTLICGYAAGHLILKRLAQSEIEAIQKKIREVHSKE